jgi:hypothetical protein
MGFIVATTALETAATLRFQRWIFSCGLVLLRDRQPCDIAPSSSLNEGETQHGKFKVFADRILVRERWWRLPQVPVMMRPYAYREQWRDFAGPSSSRFTSVKLTVRIDGGMAQLEARAGIAFLVNLSLWATLLLGMATLIAIKSQAIASGCLVAAVGVLVASLIYWASWRRQRAVAALLFDELLTELRRVQSLPRVQTSTASDD